MTDVIYVAIEVTV